MYNYISMKYTGGFFRLLKPYRKRIFFTFLAVLIANLLGLALPWAIKLIIDEVVINKNTVLLNTLAFGLILTFILKFYFGYISEYSASVMGEKIILELRSKLYRHLQKLSVKHIDNTSTGSVISGVIGDVESIRNFVFGGALDFIYSALGVVLILGLLFVLDYRLTLISLIYLPIFGITFFKLTPRLKSRHSAVRKKYAELTSRLNEVFRGIRVVAGFGRQSYEADRFDLKQKEIFKTSLANHKLGVLLWMGSEFVSSLGLVTLIWFGVKGVFSGRMSIGSLMAFYSYLGMLFFPIIKMVVVNNYYQEAAVSLERVNKILAEEPRIKDAPGAITLDRVKGLVKFRKVNFSYDNERKILSDIDIEVKPAEVVALVGKSGAGKSTLVNLLLRFYEPTQGSIFIDEVNLKNIGLKSYRSKIGMVFQDDYLFDATISENILYSNPRAGKSDIMKAAQLAGIHQFIRELPREYNTCIGERGIKLSYGQRQRISIARAVLRDPAILILDEATSCVDSETERLIIEGVYKNVTRGRTTFVIAHRLSTITGADKIIVIENGRIAESGKHPELLNKKGSYWKMWQHQYA